jgi:hypothetical protein
MKKLTNHASISHLAQQLFDHVSWRHLAIDQMLQNKGHKRHNLHHSDFVYLSLNNNSFGRGVSVGRPISIIRSCSFQWEVSTADGPNLIAK